MWKERLVNGPVMKLSSSLVSSVPAVCGSVRAVLNRDDSIRKTIRGWPRYLGGNQKRNWIRDKKKIKMSLSPGFVHR